MATQPTPKLAIANIQDGRDITRGYTYSLLTPQDTVLSQRLGGDWRQYEEVLKDDQVKSTFQQRRLAVTSRDWDVIPGAEDAASKSAADFVRDQLESVAFDSLTEKMLFGLFYGFSVAEIQWGQDGGRYVWDSIDVRKQRRFRFGAEKELYMLTSRNPNGELLQSDLGGAYQPVSQRNPHGSRFWVFSTGADNDDEPYGLGLAHWLYWPVFFKRNGLKFWLIFLEKFGMPTATAKLPLGQLDDPATKTKVVEALQAIQTDGAILLPDTVEVELLEAARSGTADYATLESRMDHAIAKVVLSQIMTTEAAGGQYKSEIQMDVRDEVVKADSDLLSHSLNEGPVRWLTELNFAGATPPKIKRHTEQEEDLGDRAERDTKIHALGFDPTEDYIEQTYGEGWEKRKAPEPQPQPPGLIPPGTDAETVFAEVMAELAEQKTEQRLDQQAIVEASRRFASQYKEIIGPRVDELISYLEETQDLETFRTRLNAILEEGPLDATVRKVEKATVGSRLAGMFRRMIPEQ